MRANRLREIWAAGKPAIGGWCNMPGGFSAELMAAAGWDAVTIDTQHGLIGYSEMLAMLQAISTTPAVPLVRVSWNAPGEILMTPPSTLESAMAPRNSRNWVARTMV